MLEKFESKSTTVAIFDGKPLAASSVESGLGTLHGFIGSLVAAIKSKNYEETAELSIDEALSIAGDLGLPYAGLAASLLPLIWPLINKEIASFGQLVSDGRGGFVSKSWVENPRHQLNPDGSFKN